jgi:16S rRNA (guanine527-N7)-methyltransferase
MPAGFASTARDLGLDLDPETIERFDRYRDRIAAATFNLTAVRDPALIERRHFLESLAFGRLLAERGLLDGRPRLLDIGSGAGFPGLPLRLAWPGLRLTLLEANTRRAAFLRDLTGELDLPDVEVVEGRAEAVARDPAHRDAYDLVVARAVAPLPVLVEYALPFLRDGGHLAASKGTAAAREVEEAGPALRELGGRLVESTPFLPPGGMRQTFVLVRKEGATPDRYPRRVGIPAKRPLA